MQIRSFLQCALLLPLVADPAAAQQPAGLALEREGRALLEEFCVECHNFEDWAGGLDLEAVDFADLPDRAETWEHVIRKLEAGMMPPARQPRPDRARLAAFTGALADKLDRQAPARPGAESLHRLNRAEYANVIRDLLGLRVDVSTLLPADDASEGFDNIADVLSVSPTLIESYVSAAMKISRLALGDPAVASARETYRVPAGLRQDGHIEGLPLGTRGGLAVEHYFPLDAEYEFQISGGVRGFRRLSTAPEPMIDFTIDGTPVDYDDPRSITLPVKAGRHRLTVALVDRSLSTGVDDTWSVYSSEGSIQNIVVIGPNNPTGAGDTESRRRIFSCYPAAPAQEASCARRILAQLATRAYRRPVGEADRELEVLMDFFRRGREQGGFEFGVQQGLARILVDPRFLYRFEKQPEGLAPGEVYAVSDLELASRLSFFLWSSMPDAELLELAARGQLSRPAALRGQVERMLGDPRAQALVENFAGQWLRLRELDAVEPDSPDFDESLRRAFQQETQLLFASVMAEDRSIMELLEADYTFVNERLAAHYGIPGVRGGFMRRVDLPEDSPRRGILGHGSLLTVTSVANRTSPVVRGNWILENLLGVPAPVPPPGVEANLDVEDPAAAATSLRQRLEAHRADPVCASCHSIMDPIGLAMENFDSVGKWREFDGRQPIDASGRLVDGTQLNGPGDLHAALLTRSDRFVTTFSEKLLSYALGRIVQYYDMPAVRAIVENARASDYRFSALVQGIVLSEPFRMKSATPAGAADSATLAASAASE